MMKLQGIIPAMVTPLTQTEDLHHEQMRRLVDYLIDRGVHALFVNGTMGAFNLLNDKVQMDAIRVVVEQTAGRVPVIAGASDTGVRRVIERGRRTKDMRADYLAILPPYYSRFSSAQILRFYQEVAEELKCPIFVYNNPHALLSSIDVDTAIALSRIPNIVGIKDSCGDPNQYQQLILHFQNESDFTYLIGANSLMAFAFKLGADGVIEGLHNLAPVQAVALYDAARSNDWTRVKQLQAVMDHLAKITLYGEVWGGVEAALSVLGLCDKITARPYISIEDLKENAAISDILQDVLSFD